jgi:hypothetical protein
MLNSVTQRYYCKIITKVVKQQGSFNNLALPVIESALTLLKKDIIVTHNQGS